MASGSNSEIATRICPYGKEGVEEAVRLILAGQPVAIPTETVYGLAADATNALAVARIYEAKGRPSFNPLIIHVADRIMAEQLGKIEGVASVLADSFWPGPLTLVVPKREASPVAAIATAGLETIAIRCPAHPAMRECIGAAGKPLAAPSANASGRISPTTTQHVFASLEGRIPLILDAGPCEAGIESTIVTVRDDAIILLRPGPVTVDMLEAASGMNVTVDDSGAITAPGQLASHYAPSKRVRLNATARVADAYLIGFGAMDADYTLSDSGDVIEAATRLFDALHAGDASDKAEIHVAPIPPHGLGQAINDRLKRAAA